MPELETHSTGQAANGDSIVELFREQWAGLGGSRASQVKVVVVQKPGFPPGQARRGLGTRLDRTLTNRRGWRTNPTMRISTGVVCHPCDQRRVVVSDAMKRIGDSLGRLMQEQIRRR